MPYPDFPVAENDELEELLSGLREGFRLRAFLRKTEVLSDVSQDLSHLLHFELELEKGRPEDSYGPRGKRSSVLSFFWPEVLAILKVA